MLARGAVAESLQEIASFDLVGLPFEDDGECAPEERLVVFAVAAGGDRFHDVLEPHLGVHELCPAGDGIDAEAPEERFDGIAS